MVEKMAKIIFMTSVIVFSTIANANTCKFDSLPTDIESNDAEIHQVWKIKNYDYLWSSVLSDNTAFSDFRTKIANLLDPSSDLLLQRQYEIYSNSDNPQTLLEAENMKLGLIADTH